MAEPSMPFGPPVYVRLSKRDRASWRRAIERRTPHGEGATGQEARDDGVVWVLLLPVPLDGAVKGREETAPDTKVAADDGRAGLDGREGPDEAVAAGRVARALDAVPDRTTYCTHRAVGGQHASANESRAAVHRGSAGVELERNRRTHKAPPKSLRMTQGLEKCQERHRSIAQMARTVGMSGAERGEESR